MKKILSFILVLAMVLGCVSMVTFASDGEDSTTGFIATISDKNQSRILYKSGLNYNSIKDYVDTVTKDEEVSYYVFFKFRVYNLGEQSISLYPRASVGWNYYIDGAVYTGFKNGAIISAISYGQTVDAKSYMEFDIRVPVTNDNGTFKITGTHYQNSDKKSNNLNTIMIRWDFGTTGFVNDTQLVFEALTPAAQLYCDQMASVYAFTVDKITTTDIYSVTNIPVLSGIKIKFNNDFSGSAYQGTTAGKCDITEYEIFEEDGKRYVERKFVVYNTTDHPVKFTLFYQATKDWKSIDKQTYPGNPKKTNTVDLSAYSRGVYTCRIEVNDNNTVSYNNNGTDECSLQDLFFRIGINASSADYGMKKGDEIIIQPLSSGSSDVAYTLKGDKAGNFFTEQMCGEDYFNKINGATPVIGESLTLNVSALAKYGCKSAKLRITRDNGTENPYIVTIDGTINATGQVVFEYTGINAQCMGDDTLFELVVDDKVVKNYTYSIKQYVISMFNNEEYNTNEKLMTLLSDMLVYGAAAQEYIDYRTDALVTAGMTDYTQYNPSTYDSESANDAAIREISAPNTSIAKAGLHISYINKVYFRLTENAKNFDSITVTVDGKEVNYTTDGDKVYTDAIYATELSKVYTITVVKGEETSVVSYNAIAFIVAKDGVGEATKTSTDVVKALYNYGQSAVAFKG